MPKVEPAAHRRRLKERSIHKHRAFHKDATYIQDILNRVPEAVKQAVDIAYRAMGLEHRLHEQGLRGLGDVIRDTIMRILSLESEPYQEFVITSIVETADILNNLLDKHGYDSGKRKYFLPDKREKKRSQS